MKWLVSILIVLHSYLICHLCHDPFRPRERLILLPEKDLIRIEDEGEFRIYLENTFSSTLRDFQLVVESAAFEIDVRPKMLEKLVPGERTFFVIKLRLKEGYKPGEYPLRINVKAASAEILPSIEKIDIRAEKKTIEIPPKPIPEVRPIETIQELVPEKKAVEEKPEVPVREVKPEIPVKEVKPEVPTEEVKPGEVQQETEEIVVRVEKVPFWKQPYFYIILILVLVAILVWRKLR